MAHLRPSHHIDDLTLQPYELFIDLRYTRAKRRNHFISLISMLGMVLGVLALIVVLSVMTRWTLFMPRV